MDNFFDDIKNNLNNRPEPQFEESDWIAMQKKMQKTPKSTSVWSYWWIGLLLLPFLFGSGYLFLQVEQNKKIIEEMKTHVQVDTIYTTRTIYVRDTIYRNTSQPIAQSNINETKSPFKLSNPNTIFNNSYLNNRFKNNIFTKSKNISRFKTSNSLSYSLATHIQQNTKSTKEKEQSAFEKLVRKESNIGIEEKIVLTSLSSQGIDYLEYEGLKLTGSDLQLMDIKYRDGWRKRWHQIANSLRPKSFHLGLGGGFLYPYSEELNEESGLALNLQSMIGFNENLRMWVDFSLQRLKYESENQNGDFGIVNIPSPNIDYTFEKAVATYPMLQSSIGMQYLFNLNSKLHPYFGIGVSALIPLDYEVSYEYDDSNGNEVVLPREFSSSSTRTNYWLVNGGLEYQFRKNWRAQIEAMYRANWEGDDVFTPNTFGLNTRLMYKF